MIQLIKSIYTTIKSIIVLAAVACMVIFLSNNRGDVTISLNPLPFVIDTKLYVVILAFFLLGLAIGIVANSKTLLLNFVTKIMDKKLIKKLQNKLHRSELNAAKNSK